MWSGGILVGRLVHGVFLFLGVLTGFDASFDDTFYIASWQFGFLASGTRHPFGPLHEKPPNETSVVLSQRNRVGPFDTNIWRLDWRFGEKNPWFLRVSGASHSHTLIRVGE